LPPGCSCRSIWPASGYPVFNALKIADASSFQAHRVFGLVLGATSLVLLILALLARQSRRTMLAALVLMLLAVTAEGALASAGESSKWVGRLHALDGTVVLLP
jgi:heme A synthase